MKPAPIPYDEPERLRALQRLSVLDTPPEQRFDRIVSLAATEFKVPIALISLVDSNRQWFKARTGLAACETARDISFCGHAVHSRAQLIIEDARADPRFADNPLVTGPPYIRFYAGAPLVLPDGHAVGTLCIIDTEPRKLSANDLVVLRTLRNVAVAELASPAFEH